MKKGIVLLFVVISSLYNNFAQEFLTSKKGIPILPEQGSYGLSFNAENIFNYLGNFSNSSANNSLSNLEFPDNQLSISGKYFTTNNKAIRLLLRVAVNTVSIDDISGVSFENGEFDSLNVNFSIGYALEKRRGSGRLQGFYGPTTGLGLSFANSKLSAQRIPAGEAEVEIKSGPLITLWLGGIAGVEYFFAPKLSISIQFMWTINYTTQREGRETIDNGVGNTSERDLPASSSISFDTRQNGNIFINFYF